MSVLVTRDNNTFNNNILRLSKTVVTSQYTVSEVRITISRKVRAHILPSEIFVPSLASLENITRTYQGGGKMR